MVLNPVKGVQYTPNELTLVVCSVSNVVKDSV